MMTPHAQTIFDNVTRAMQDAEEIGGPDDYDALMAAIRDEGARRLAAWVEITTAMPIDSTLDFARLVAAIVRPPGVDGIEVAGCVDVGGGCMERVADGEHADLWSVYWHTPGVGAECFADFTTRELAETFAAML